MLGAGTPNVTMGSSRSVSNLRVFADTHPLAPSVDASASLSRVASPLRYGGLRDSREGLLLRHLPGQVLPQWVVDCSVVKLS
jgi:hypothetical protein